ncbi:hypothetical protein [Actinomadura sp.]|uniref:hypothetical protein n=1 Tax=Actinomadura sp. TaxID=1989 RepID=UPI0037C6A5CF
MSVRGRVVRLERGPIGRRALCPACGGEGRPACRVVWDADVPPPYDPSPRPPPEPEGCPACGRVRLTTIRVRYESAPPPAPPAAGPKLRSRQKA